MKNKIETQLNKIQKDMFEPSEKWQNKTRNILLDVTSEDSERTPRYGVFKLLQFFFMEKSVKLAITSVGTIVAIGVIGVVTAGPVSAANPGDFLYGLDKAYEAVGSALKIDPVAKADYELMLLSERADELTALEQEGADQALIDEAASAVEEYQARAQEKVQDVASDNTTDSIEQDRVRNDYETKVEESVKAMEQVKEKYEKEGNGEAAKAMETKMESAKKELEDAGDNETNDNPDSVEQVETPETPETPDTQDSQETQGNSETPEVQEVQD